MQFDPLEQDYKPRDLYAESQKTTSKGAHVNCPSCSSIIKSADINIQDKIAKCSSCSKIFSFENKLASLLPGSSKTSKPVFDRQKEIGIFEYNGELSISIVNYDDWIAGVVLVFSLIIFFIGLVIYKDGNLAASPTLITSIVAFIYSIFRIANYKDKKTYLDIDDKYLYVKKRPNNFSKDKSYLLSNIRQFYSKAAIASNYSGVKYFPLYMIYNGIEGEEHIKLDVMVRTRSGILYLEQELERFIGLPDDAVPEEMEQQK